MDGVKELEELARIRRNNRSLPDGHYTAAIQREQLMRMLELAEGGVELQALFEMQHRRVTKAVAAWRDAHPGNELVSPDLGQLVEWLMTRAGLPT